MLAQQIKVHQQFRSAHLNHPRNILVYLPPGYGLDPGRRYPVFYMHDGQNLIFPEESFGGVVWAVDKTAQQLILSKKVEPLIIVAIYHAGGNRIDEYTPVKIAGGQLKGRGGQADRYGRMIIEELKPFIDREYLTRAGRESTGLGGSSLGGLVSLHLGLKRHDVFSRLAVISPAVWWANSQIIRDVATTGGRLPLRIWLDIGKREGVRMKYQVRVLKEILLANGWRDGEDLKYFEAPKARHDETAWAARFGRVLKFLYPQLQGT